ncbi:MAG: hypothetical protein ACKV22_39770 [Bryobacteraceae bacterium]
MRLLYRRGRRTLGGLGLAKATGRLKRSVLRKRLRARPNVPTTQQAVVLPNVVALSTLLPNDFSTAYRA